MPIPPLVCLADDIRARNPTGYWLIEHGDPEAVCKYWAGYHSSSKDHTWTNDKAKAIRFCRREDAERAGLRTAKGIKVTGPHPLKDDIQG